MATDVMNAAHCWPKPAACGRRMKGESVDDRERAHKYLTDEFAMKGGIVSQRDEDILAAEFAAVRREEREACATVADAICKRHRTDADAAADSDQPLKWSDSDGASITAENIASAIRTMSNQEGA
jgi:hypothetical protein